MTDIPPPPQASLMERLFKVAIRAMNGIAALGLLMVLLEPEWGSHPTFLAVAQVSVAPIFAIFLLHLALALILAPSIIGFFQSNSIDLVFFIPLFSITFGGVHPAHILLVRQFIFYFHRYLQLNTLSHLATAISERPARLISFSFLGVILSGAFLLVLPVSVATGQKASLLTALFTATSAVCVTGLNVIDPGTYFSLFGQVVVLALIQIGGLGIMTLSAGVALLVGKKMAITQRTVMQNVLDATDLSSLRTVLHDIFTWTFIIEAGGALILTFRFSTLVECDFQHAMWLGFFHSISAFCNAGFALFPDSLMSFAHDPIVNITIMSLIVTGGLGFSVMGAINAFLLGNRRGPPDIHTRLVLITTALLLVFGTVGIYFLEMQNPSWSQMDVGEKIMAAAFQSVTTRTAGFNTVDMNNLKASTMFLMIILMFIGASPASTGGGIKTTTLAIMALTLDSQMRGESDVVVYRRTIPMDVVVKAFLITAISAVLVAVFTFLLLLLEDAAPIRLLFEVISAFATVGLSANITPSLGSLSQLLIIVLMFIGRVGPLTLALSFRVIPHRGQVTYPSGRVMVG